MMHKQEFIITLVVLVLLIFIVDPFHFMPEMVVMALLVGLVALMGVFIAFVWREKPQDEREAINRMFAGRVAFLIGSGVLVIGIIVQSFEHDVDYWLPLALGVMMIAKAIASAHGRTNQ